jgi:hypothetical protein
VAEYVDMMDPSSVLVYCHRLRLAANLQLLTQAKPDDRQQNLNQTAVESEEPQCLTKLQQLHLQTSCLSPLSLTVFSSSEDVVMYCLLSHDLFACKNKIIISNDTDDNSILSLVFDNSNEPTTGKH